MTKYEEKARTIHNEGNNCSYSVYTVFKDDIKLDGKIPAPRSEDGKCGAALAAEKILRELGKEEYIEEFEQYFISEFGYITCIDLMREQRRCNDYVGKSATFIDRIINNSEDNISKEMKLYGGQI